MALELMKMMRIKLNRKEVASSRISQAVEECSTPSEMCQNTEFFLVRIFPHSD